MLMYVFEAYSAGMPHLKRDPVRWAASQGELRRAMDWMAANQPGRNTQSTWKYDSQWGSKLGGLPFHLYVWSRFMPQGAAIASSADKDLTAYRQGPGGRLHQAVPTARVCDDVLCGTPQSGEACIGPIRLSRQPGPKRPEMRPQANPQRLLPRRAFRSWKTESRGPHWLRWTPKAPEEVRRAVDEFQRVLEKMTGTRLPAQPQGDGPIVHIGRNALVDGAGLELERLDDDGFVIRTLGNRHLILAGRTPHATEFAVYRFLQKHGGVRWFFPTALGEVVPRRASFCVGPLAEREEPSFHSRQWSAAAPFDGGAWERHNLCRSRYNFHHNLLNIFVPSKFYDSHPEWYPRDRRKAAASERRPGQRLAAVFVEQGSGPICRPGRTAIFRREPRRPPASRSA